MAAAVCGVFYRRRIPVLFPPFLPGRLSEISARQIGQARIDFAAGIFCPPAARTVRFCAFFVFRSRGLQKKRAHPPGCALAIAF
ncbi:MAG: hypothetical protein DBY30_02845 [Verrucomicrobia bacterium]|nr:MAG: hypothetical protein DBY30_02845 [Verrucomicrobiota bacterium]